MTGHCDECDTTAKLFECLDTTGGRLLCDGCADKHDAGELALCDGSIVSRIEI